MKKSYAVAALVGITVLCVWITYSGKAKTAPNSVFSAGLPPSKIVRSPVDVAPTNTISYSFQKIGDQILKISITAQNISSKLLGVGFDFVFDPTLLDFSTYETGTFFEKSGSYPLYMSKLSNDHSKIVTGVTLKRGEQLAAGSGKIISFYFRIKGNGPYNFTFKNTVAATLTQNNARKNNPGIKWLIGPTL